MNICCNSWLVKVLIELGSNRFNDSFLRRRRRKFVENKAQHLEMQQNRRKLISEEILTIKAINYILLLSLFIEWVLLFGIFNRLRSNLQQDPSSTHNHMQSFWKPENITGLCKLSMKRVQSLQSIRTRAATSDDISLLVFRCHRNIQEEN